MVVGNVLNAKTTISEVEKSATDAKKSDQNKTLTESLLTSWNPRCHPQNLNSNKLSCKRTVNLRTLRWIPTCQKTQTVLITTLEPFKLPRKPLVRRICSNRTKTQRRILRIQLVTGLATDATTLTSLTGTTALSATSSMIWTKRWALNCKATPRPPQWRIQAPSLPVPRPSTLSRWTTAITTTTTRMFHNRPWWNLSVLITLIHKWRIASSTFTSTSTLTRCQMANSRLRCNHLWCPITHCLSKRPDNPTIPQWIRTSRISNRLSGETRRTLIWWHQCRTNWWLQQVAPFGKCPRSEVS